MIPPLVGFPSDFPEKKARVRLAGSRLNPLPPLARMIRRVAGQPPTALPASQLPRIERVWTPAFVAGIAVATDGKEHEASFLVDGLLRDARLLKTEPEWTPPPSGEEKLPSDLTAEDASGIATALAGTFLLRRLGPFKSMARGGRPDPVSMIRATETRAVLYPWWIWYYERRRGRIDIRILDATDGSVPGGRLKLAMLLAFAAARKASQETGGAGEAGDAGGGNS